MMLTEYTEQVALKTQREEGRMEVCTEVANKLLQLVNDGVLTLDQAMAFNDDTREILQEKLSQK